MPNPSTLALREAELAYDKAERWVDEREDDADNNWVVEAAADEIRQIVLSMKPGDKLIARRHQVEKGKHTFTAELREFNGESEATDND